MAVDIAQQQAQAARATMQRAAEQHQAHAYQQWLSQVTSRGSQGLSRGMER